MEKRRLTVYVHIKKELSMSTLGSEEDLIRQTNLSKRLESQDAPVMICLSTYFNHSFMTVYVVEDLGVL